MSNAALIVGGGPAGIQAALDIADAGITVHLTTHAPFLESAGAPGAAGMAANQRLLKVAKHPRIRLWTNAEGFSVQGRPGAYQVSIRRLPRYVDTAKCTACGDCLEACPVTVPGTIHRAIRLPAGGQPGCAVIDKQAAAPCTAACPGGIPVQGYVALIAQGRFQEALDLIESAIPFPEICGRVCTHPCEGSCRRAEVEAPVAIRPLKRFLSDWALSRREAAMPEPDPPPSDGLRVAVVGAGPAGMTAADRLARLGYRVTVFEKLPVIGGMMGIGIPEYRLPRQVIEREYRRIESLGVEIRLSTTIGLGGTTTIEDLFDSGYRAVVLAVGAYRSLRLQIPGENLPGVVPGLNLLRAIRLFQKLNDPVYQKTLDRALRFGTNTRAAVLGGGNTAMDAARSLKRLGLCDVRILYRRSRAEMPALPEEIEAAELEGVSIALLAAPVRVVGDAHSGVTGLQCIRMKLTGPDAGGRRRPVPIEGSDHLLELDLVVPAIGQVPDMGVLDRTPGVELSADRRIRPQTQRLMTGRPGVFAAGDAVSHSRMTVIDAIAMGKQVAAEVDRYLGGVGGQDTGPPALQRREFPKPLTEAEKTLRPRLAVPVLAVDRRLDGFAEVEQGYSQAQAVSEAGRCLACGPCSGCMACVHACKPGAVDHRQNESTIDLTVGTVVYADDSERFASHPLATLSGVVQVLPYDPTAGSAAAAAAMLNRFIPSRRQPSAMTGTASERRARIGVFVCCCGEGIGKIIDTRSLCDRAAHWPDVMYTGVLSYACSKAAAETVGLAVAERGLNRVVMAACSCCAADQVCYSCTFQRIRCKKNLGVLKNHADLQGCGGPDRSLPPEAHAFVNIREQCAWPHMDDPAAATAKAAALLAGAVAMVRKSIPAPLPLNAFSPRVLIIGKTRAAEAALTQLHRQGVDASRLPDITDRVRRTQGDYVTSENGRAWQASGILLFPENEQEKNHLFAAVGANRIQRPHGEADDRILAVRPGMLLVEPLSDDPSVGPAAAARMIAWFGRALEKSPRTPAMVAPDRCRTCYTCVQTCEIGAAEVLEFPPRSARIDPFICTGCGSCAARCPTNAIQVGGMTDSQLAAMIAGALL